MRDQMERPDGPRTPDVATFLAFFKALADPNRLRIVGLLAHEPHPVERLAAALHLSDGTVSHHLRRLAAAGLVSAKPDGYYRFYALETEALHAMASELLGDEALPRLADDTDLDAYDRKVLAAFTDGTGRITAFPVQQKKYLVLVRHVATAFEQDRRYSEREVNAILGRLNEDTARLRRDLVGYGFMEREGGGGDYWLSRS